MSIGREQSRGSGLGRLTITPDEDGQVSTLIRIDTRFHNAMQHGAVVTLIPIGKKCECRDSHRVCTRWITDDGKIGIQPAPKHERTILPDRRGFLTPFKPVGEYLMEAVLIPITEQ